MRLVSSFLPLLFFYMCCSNPFKTTNADNSLTSAWYSFLVTCKACMSDEVEEKTVEKEE